jgi:hypothetical protein
MKTIQKVQLQLPAPVARALARRALKTNERPAQLAARLVLEALFRRVR